MILCCNVRGIWSNIKWLIKYLIGCDLNWERLKLFVFIFVIFFNNCFVLFLKYLILVLSIFVVFVNVSLIWGLNWCKIGNNFRWIWFLV